MTRSSSQSVFERDEEGGGDGIRLKEITPRMDEKPEGGETGSRENVG